MKDNLAFEFFNIILPASKMEATIGNVKELVGSGDVHEEVAENTLKAELYIANLAQKNVPLGVRILSESSKIIYGKIYSWAGKIKVESRTKLEELFSLIREQWELSLVDEELRLDLMAAAYHGVLNIRPFFDGNEKVARLFVNYIALKYDLPMFEVAPSAKDEHVYKKYLKALKVADTGDLSLVRERIRNVLSNSVSGISTSKLGPSGSVGD
jgi:fido (protein-threonine AMPylation protein)